MRGDFISKFLNCLLRSNSQNKVKESSGQLTEVGLSGSIIQWQPQMNCMSSPYRVHTRTHARTHTHTHRHTHTHSFILLALNLEFTILFNSSLIRQSSLFNAY